MDPILESIVAAIAGKVAASLYDAVRSPAKPRAAAPTAKPRGTAPGTKPQRTAPGTKPRLAAKPVPGLWNPMANDRVTARRAAADATRVSGLSTDRARNKNTGRKLR